MHSVTIILKTRRTKAELHIKGINKVYIQFAFKVDFLLCLSSYVGSENGKFLSPKVLAARPNLHNGMHASLWPEDNKQKDVDQVQICLKYDSAAMYCRHAKKKKNSINKNPWYYPLGQHQEGSYGFRQRVP